MKREDPRGNAGRGIETSSNHDSTAAPSPLLSSGQDARLRRALRAYQCATVAHVLAARDHGERCGLVSLPTRSGKTLIAGEVLLRLPARALVVAHTRVLVEQLRGALAAHLGEHVGLVLDGAIEQEALRAAWNHGRIADTITATVARRVAYALGLLATEAE